MGGQTEGENPLGRILGAMSPWLWLVVIAAVLFGLHRLAVYAEGRGWIYYRTPPKGAARRGLMNLDVLVRPEVEHVIEAEQAQELEVDLWIESDD